MNHTLPDPGPVPERRIGPHGERYISHGTKHQTFVEKGWIASDEVSTKATVGVIAAMLRRIADTIELHSSKDAFVTDPKMPWIGISGRGDYVPPEPIKTPIENMEASAWIEDNDYGTREMELRLRLDFL